MTTEFYYFINAVQYWCIMQEKLLGPRGREWCPRVNPDPNPTVIVNKKSYSAEGGREWCQCKLVDVIDRRMMIFLTTYFRTTPMADVNFTSLVTSLITCRHCVSFTVALVICKLQRIYITSGTASVYFDDADNATCKSRVCLPYSVLPVAERTMFGFGCERLRGSWMHACNTTMQYGFVLHCCDVMALCTASQK